MSESARRDEASAFSLRIDQKGILRLTWATGVRITGSLADAAMTSVDEISSDRRRPLLVDMTGTLTVDTDARKIFTRRCQASRMALVGKSEVDRVIARYTVQVHTIPIPSKYFTETGPALAWLREEAGDDNAARGEAGS